MKCGKWLQCRTQQQTKGRRDPNRRTAVALCDVLLRTAGERDKARMRLEDVASTGARQFFDQRVASDWQQRVNTLQPVFGLRMRSYTARNRLESRLRRAICRRTRFLHLPRSNRRALGFEKRRGYNQTERARPCRNLRPANLLARWLKEQPVARRIRWCRSGKGEECRSTCARSAPLTSLCRWHGHPRSVTFQMCDR